jgi:hypothetical protein
MYHKRHSFLTVKMPPEYGGIFCKRKLLALFVLALLVCDAAAGLASRLARGLALTATALLCALAKVARLDRFDMLHYDILHI